jgi:SAM-dependent methyltransferase
MKPFVTQPPAAESKPWAWSSVRGAERKRWLNPDPEVAAFAEHLKQRQARRVYDLGCGLGRHTVLLAQQGFDVSATDLSPRALVHTGRWLKRAGLAAVLHPADITVVPFPSGYFDGVVAFNVVYHGTRNNVAGCLHEVHRAMRTGGQLLVTFNSTASSDFGKGRPVDEHTFVKIGGHEDGIPHYFVDRPEIERLLAGFSLERCDHREEDSTERGVTKHAAHWIVQATKL